MHQSINALRRDRLGVVLTLAIIILLLSACVSTPLVPTSALTDARSAIANAEQAGARQYASAELDEAQQKLIMAEQSVADEQMMEAERFAEEAQVVAELATARTESEKAATINREMNRSYEALIEELRRMGDQP